MKYRDAVADDTNHIAKVMRESRTQSMPWLPDLHTPSEDLVFISNIVLKECTVKIVETQSDGIIGFCAFKKDWLDHLYIAPKFQRRGIGKTMLNFAQDAEEYLQLWCFQKNALARDFYEKNGFTLVKETDGEDNEEKEPDALYHWRKFGTT